MSFLLHLLSGGFRKSKTFSLHVLIEMRDLIKSQSGIQSGIHNLLLIPSLSAPPQISLTFN